MTFVDASQQGYGAAVYIRYEYYNDAVTSPLIAAKSKVSPLTPMTVPRLKLSVAFLGLVDGSGSTNAEHDILF